MVGGGVVAGGGELHPFVGGRGEVFRAAGRWAVHLLLLHNTVRGVSLGGPGVEAVIVHDGLHMASKTGRSHPIHGSIIFVFNGTSSH